MNKRQIEFLMESIDEAVARGETRLHEVRIDQGYTGTNAQWLKTQILPEIYGTLAGQLLFIKMQLHKDLEEKKAKKFYQFWK